MIAIYFRKSKESIADSSRRRLFKLQTFAAKLSNEKALEFFDDDSLNDSRPQFKELKNFIESQKLKAVVTTDYGRISRSKKVIEGFISFCSEHRVDFWVIEVDTKKPVRNFSN